MPIINIPESLVTANPSTLFVEMDTTIIDTINPSMHDNPEIPIIIIKFGEVNEKTSKATTFTKNAIPIGNPNLDIRYPLFPRGVTAI